MVIVLNYHTLHSKNHFPNKSSLWNRKFIVFYSFVSTFSKYSLYFDMRAFAISDVLLIYNWIKIHLLWIQKFEEFYLETIGMLFSSSYSTYKIVNFIGSNKFSYEWYFGNVCKISSYYLVEDVIFHKSNIICNWVTCIKLAKF